MRIQDAMTPTPVAVTSSDPIVSAAERMRDVNVGLVPVVHDTRGRRLVGVITARDIVVRCVAERHHVECWVGDHMTRDGLVVAHPDDDVRTVADTMRRERLRRLPVVDPTGRLVGIVTWSDLVGRVPPRPASVSHAAPASRRAPPAPGAAAPAR